MILETWRKRPKVNKADMGESHLLAVLLSTDDRRKTVILTPSENLFDMAWTKEQMLEMREKKRGLYERTLRNNPTLLDVGPGVTFPTARGVKAIDILMSYRTDQEKTAALSAMPVRLPRESPR